MNSKELTSVVMLGLAVAYDLSPIDIIPDIPIIGWIDDALFTGITALNCIQQFTAETGKALSTIAKTLKWLLIVVGGILVVLIVLFAGLIIKLFS
ncbi:MAG: DUF1232 domain-containing protein [Lachnospiraceae bacterium]|nr:DUF1232 domain-containing protein [Lachnospiraceae bacterium]